MTNREILFKKLEEMDNEKLADVIDLSCSRCPANVYCRQHTSVPVANTCQGTMCAWLDEDGKDE